MGRRECGLLRPPRKVGNLCLNAPLPEEILRLSLIPGCVYIFDPLYDLARQMNDEDEAEWVESR